MLVAGVLANIAVDALANVRNPGGPANCDVDGAPNSGFQGFCANPGSTCSGTIWSTDDSSSTAIQTSGNCVTAILDQECNCY
jgi:hypothetical protein